LDKSKQEADMAQVSLDEARVKELFKQAILELFQERRDLLHDLFVEVLEDLALVNAVKEGGSSETVSRAEVFQILESAA
jgi:hypothetical protein